ncbi:GNAT family N-acetyltransferase, partial [Polaribacter sp.]|uniref:GNAT family N-acetyltransferase n=1 Tax=Polaribacter sp. TaxID=1920175 RepID=UPI003F6A1509
MIVKANISDASLLSEIAMISKSFWGYTKQQLDSWVDDLTVSEKLILETHTFNFLVEDKIVGFYILNQPQNNNCELEMLFVLPNFIGKGIGKQLLQHAFKKAKN